MKWGICSVVLVLMVTIGCNSRSAEQTTAAFNEMHQEAEARNHEAKLQLMQLKYENIQMQYGAATAQLWSKCVNDPPKQPANIDRCNRLMARIEHDEQAAKRKEAEAQKKW